MVVLFSSDLYVILCILTRILQLDIHSTLTPAHSSKAFATSGLRVRSVLSQPSSMDPLTKSYNPNKHLKEQFVSNLSGSSMLEVTALLTIISACHIIRHLINFGTQFDPLYVRKALSQKDGNATNGYRNWKAYMIALTTDFLIIVLPVLLFFTVLAEWTQLFAIFLMTMLLVYFTIKRFDFSSSYSEKGQQAVLVRINVSTYRFFTMIMTCLCILAVDFKIFPRRYAKTETYGTSLMDIGVGCFVVGNAMVSRQARNVSFMKWKTALQSTSPLIILGFGRLIFTAGVDYQVHVGEYGVHWNFFFTMAAVSILTSTIDVHPRYCGILGLIILVGYQICLMFGLNDYLLSDKRTSNIISQNKEGVFSIFGYWGMYLLGVYLGNYLFYGNNSTSKMRNDQWLRIKISIVCVVLWLLTIILDKHVERVSRRMCNLPYVTFVLAQNLQAIGVIMLSDIIPGKKALVLEEAFNRSLLALFLLANVLTGMINLSVDTLSASSATAIVILVGYAFMLCGFAGFLAFSGIKLKFW